jgi:SAM-dependent methyltransferase
MKNHQAVDALRIREVQKYDFGYFKTDYWKEDLPGKSGNRSLSYDDPFHALRFSLLYGLVVEPMRPRRMVDVGCGPGALLERALAGGIDAWGVEASPDAKELYLARTHERWPDRFVVGSMTGLPFSSGEFDLVVCFDALEHLVVFDVFTAVTELCRVANRQIICSINVDNPYYFHPTILSRETWIAIFESTGSAVFDAEGTAALNRLVQEHRVEYEMFKFKKIT